MSSRKISRRSAIRVAVGALGAVSIAPQFLRAADAPLISGIDVQTLWQGRTGKGTVWFHPRACMVPERGGAFAFMTLQSISGSDYFGPVHWSESRDGGKTWSEPKLVPGLGRKPAADGAEEGVCDVVPEYHRATDTVLAIGHNVFYKGGRFFNPQPVRWPVYVVRRRDGSWTPAQRFEWNDPRGSYIYSCNCAQRLTLENGDVLIPLSFGAKGDARSATTVRCAFDGEGLRVKETGNELKMSKGRGFLEPSLARFDGVFFMTLRAEDNHGYITTSTDGLNWKTPVAWQWDDGEPLAMSTTQQRWLPHSEGLLLAYTRKDASNTGVMRWRSPLFAAEVDRATLKLKRKTERVIFQLVGDGVNDGKHVPHYGNFHTTAALPGESWVTSGEVIVANFRGDTLLARVKWSRPNELARLDTPK